MATLHLPKKRLVSGKDEQVRNAPERPRDEGVKESPAANDPVSATAPGATREDEARRRERPGE